MSRPDPPDLIADQRTKELTDAWYGAQPPDSQIAGGQMDDMVVRTLDMGFDLPYAAAKL